MDINNSRANLPSYLDSIKEGTYTPPNREALLAISSLIDLSAERVFYQVNTTLKNAPEIKASRIILTNAPRTCGGFKQNNSLFSDLTSFEQMHVITNWVNDYGPTMLKPHTISLSADEGDSFIPLWVKPLRSGGGPNLMTILLGNSKGALKAPCYNDWAKNNPQNNSFIEPLNSLEIHRQPGCLGSLFLKSAPYGAGLLANDWRYKVYTADKNMAPEASVELPHQKSPKTGKVKSLSAGYNLAKMVDSSMRKKNLLPTLLFEDYSTEGYNDDLLPFVSPKAIIKTLPEALKGNTAPLDALMAQVAAPRFGQSNLQPVRALLAAQLFSNT